MSALLRRGLAELVGTMFLLIAVVGSGIAASRLSPDSDGLALLINAVATGGLLVAVILAVGPVSGAHLNPAVTLADRAFGGVGSAAAAVYVAAQLAGATLGVVVANLMFDLPAVTLATTERTGGGLWLAEVVATLGLLLVIFGVVRAGAPRAAAFTVGAYITGAYFFTASTSFANPAVTAARTLTDTFAGIAPASAPPFVAAQLGGLAVAVLLVRALYPDIEDVAGDVVVPRTGARAPAASPTRTAEEAR